MNYEEARAILARVQAWFESGPDLHMTLPPTQQITAALQYALNDMEAHGDLIARVKEARTILNFTGDLH